MSQSKGFEDQDLDLESSDSFDPNKIRISLWQPSIDVLLKRMEKQEIHLPEDLDREQCWTTVVRSRLIESMLIKIPIPACYFDAGSRSYAVVDGIQRLLALRTYVLENGFALTGLEYLKEIEGKTFSELKRALQRRIEETVLTVHIIEVGTPEAAKLNILKRIHTSSAPLDAQEIRHAIVPGAVRKQVKSLTQSEVFQCSPRLAGLNPLESEELVLRFLAFAIEGPQDFRRRDFESFLLETTRILDAPKYEELAEELSARFIRSLQAALALLGEEAFVFGSKRINRGLFDSWLLALDTLSDEELALLESKAEAVRARANEMLASEPDFTQTLLAPTHEPGKVRFRFERLQALIKDIIA